MADRPSADAWRRLASYGTLAPGRENARQLDGLDGVWRSGVVRGRIGPAPGGRWRGYEGLTLDPAGDAVPVHIFESADLPAHWQRLDAFEGPGWRRVAARATAGEGDLDVMIYVLDI